MPTEKTFLQSFIPFFSPYALYVAIDAIPATFLPPEIKQIIKLIAVSSALTLFFKWYRFGILGKKNAALAVVVSPVAVLLWIAPLYYFKGGKPAPDDFTSLYVALRTVNSTILVSVFEELFIRVYLLQLFYQAGSQLKSKGLIDSVLSTFEQRPKYLAKLPLSYFSVAMATLAFAAGHSMKEWASAILYFLFTTYMYRKTGSLWVCILIHGITNLTIALLVKFGGMGHLW